MINFSLDLLSLSAKSQLSNATIRREPVSTIQIMIPTMRPFDITTKNKLTDIEIGKRLFKKRQKGEVRSYATQYGFFRRGIRKLPKHLVNDIAEILGIQPETLEHYNKREPVILNIDANIDFITLIRNVPENCDTLAKFLVWLQTENDRTQLMNRLE